MKRWVVRWDDQWQSEQSMPDGTDMILEARPGWVLFTDKDERVVLAVPTVRIHSIEAEEYDEPAPAQEGTP
jgi:hypothetical protein